MKEFVTKNKWVFILLFIAIVYMMTDKIKFDSNQSSLQEIPFSSSSFMGKWNLKLGTISFYQISPVSAENIAKTQTVESSFSITRTFENNTKIKLDVLENRNKPNEGEIEIMGAREEKIKLLADTGKYENFILYKPIDVQIKSDEILSYWEFTYTITPKTKQGLSRVEYLHGILLCKYAPDKLTWTVITDQIDPLLTGVENQMGIAHDILYIVYPGGAVFSVDLLDGKVTEEVLIEEKIKNFKIDFASDAYTPNTPELIPYRNHMILHWKPSTPKPSSLVLLLWKKQVIGSIESSGESFMVMKRKIVTFTTDIESKEQNPANWIFTP